MTRLLGTAASSRKPREPRPGRTTSHHWARCLVLIGAAATLLFTAPLVAGAPSAAAQPDANCPTSARPAAGIAQLIPDGTFAGVPLLGEQVRMAQLVIGVGKAMGVARRGVRIALAAAMRESSLLPQVVSGPYVGLFQQMADPASGRYTAYSRTDPVGAARMFYEQLQDNQPGYETDPSPDWQIAQRIQLTRNGSLFDSWRALATELTTRFYDVVPPYDAELASLSQRRFDCPTGTADSAGSDGSGPLPDGGAVGADGAPDAVSTPDAAGPANTFDPGDIISDEIFYDATAMTTEEVRSFIQTHNAACGGTWCLRLLRVDTQPVPASRFCDAYSGGSGQDAAAVIVDLAVACHVNPQVMLVTLQKESSLLTRTDGDANSVAAASGWRCPDSGPGGSAECDATHAGFFNQTYGMAEQWARYRVDATSYHYRAGETAVVPWNVASSGCGSGPVHIANAATAALYSYTPYQPNAAALAAYPGEGDGCSTYGNRNFYFLFTEYFGSTHRLAGDTAAGADVAMDPAVRTDSVVHGTAVTIPPSPFVPPEIVGQTITAPTAAVAHGIAAGLTALGTPFVWGGGTAGGPADDGCARGAGEVNSCRGLAGFDCSGLTAYVLSQAGYLIPTNSAEQRAGGTAVRWGDAKPGDIIGYPGHVAIYLGMIAGTDYLLESPYPGAFVHILALSASTDANAADDVVHRYWK